MFRPSIFLKSVSNRKISPLILDIRSLTTGTDSVNLFYFSYSIFDTAPDKQSCSHTRARIHYFEKKYTEINLTQERNKRSLFIRLHSQLLLFLLIFIRVYDHHGKTK
jgi:hypothetical protein